MPSRRKKRAIYAAESIDANADELGLVDRAFFRHLLKNRFLLAPLHSPLAPHRKKWMLLLLLLMCFESVYIPVMTAFQLPKSADGVFSLPLAILFAQWATDLLFWLDIFFMFRTTTQGPTLDAQDVVTDAKEIARSYRRGYFALDVVANLPLEVFAFAAAPAETRAAGALAVFGSHLAVSLRLNRLLHARRVMVYHGREIMRLKRSHRLLIFWALFALLAHWVACMFWVIEKEAFEVLTTPITPESSPAQQYFSCMYWSITTLLRVPWVAPSGAMARLFTCIATTIGAIAFAFFNGEVHALVRASLGATLARTQHISDLRTLFRKARQGGMARRTAIQWSTAAATAERLRGDNKKEQNFIRQLPSSMRVELYGLMFKELKLADCGLEGVVSPFAMATMAANVWPAVFLPKQVIVNAFARVAEVYVLQNGSLRLSGGVSKGATQVAERRGANNRGNSIMPSRSICNASSSRTRGSVAGSSKHTTKAASNFSLPVQLPGAECSRFRILERPGCLVGSCDPAPSPYIIESIKLSHVLVLDSKTALGIMAEADASAVRAAVKRQEKISVDYLKAVKRKAGGQGGDDEAPDDRLGAPPAGAVARGRTSVCRRNTCVQMQRRFIKRKEMAMSAEQTTLSRLFDSKEAESLQEISFTLHETLGDWHDSMRQSGNALKAALEAARSRKLGGGAGLAGGAGGVGGGGGSASDSSGAPAAPKSPGCATTASTTLSCVSSAVAESSEDFEDLSPVATRVESFSLPPGAAPDGAPAYGSNVESESFTDKHEEAPA